MPTVSLTFKITGLNVVGEIDLSKVRTMESVRADKSSFCCYCGVKFSFHIRVTSDHLIPRSKGGRNIICNKRNCCHSCNSDKGSLYPEQWLLVLYKQRKKIKKDNQPTYNIDIQIENVQYIIEYVQSAGQKLFVDKYFHQAYLDRRGTLKPSFL